MCSQCLGHFTNTPASFSDPTITSLTSTPIQTHTHKHKLTQIHTHTNTPHILQIFLPSNSEAALLSKVPGLQSYRGKSLSSILNIFKKKCNEARRGMSSSFLRSRRLQRNTCDNNPFTYVGKEEGASGEGC